MAAVQNERQNAVSEESIIEALKGEAEPIRDVQDRIISAVVNSDLSYLSRTARPDAGVIQETRDQFLDDVRTGHIRRMDLHKVLERVPSPMDIDAQRTWETFQARDPADVRRMKVIMCAALGKSPADWEKITDADMRDLY